MSKILDKILKLHRQALSAAAIGSVGEAQVFAAKVQELLRAHNLSLAEVERVALDAEDPLTAAEVEPEKFGQRQQKRRIEWVEQLTRVVADAHGCVALCRPGTNCVTFAGRRSAVTVCVFVFTRLARAAAKLADEELAQICRWYQQGWYPLRVGLVDVVMRLDGAWPGRRQFRQSFCKGFTRAIYERYQEAARRSEMEVCEPQMAADTAEGKAASLARHRPKDEAETFVKAAAGKSKPAPAFKSKVDFNAAQIGFEQGLRANLDLKGLDAPAAQGGLI
jgi:hypothetical protein